jgi:hypothetical protein
MDTVKSVTDMCEGVVLQKTKGHILNLCAYKMPIYNLNLPYRQILGYKGILSFTYSNMPTHPKGGSAFRMCKSATESL